MPDKILCTALFLIALVSAPALSLRAQIKKPHPNDSTVVISPIAPPNGVTASIDVFAQCVAPTGPSLLQPGKSTGVTGGDDVTLLLRKSLVPGDSLCAIETYANQGAPPPHNFDAVVVTNTPAPARTVVLIEPPHEGQTFVVVDPILPPTGQAASLDVFGVCPPPAKPTSLLAPGQTSVDIQGLPATLSLQAPVKKGVTLCARETFALPAGAPMGAKAADAATSSAVTTGSALTPPGKQCAKNGQRYSDCDMQLTLIGGADQSAQSSVASETTAFARLFTRTQINPTSRFALWGSVRLLGAPTSSSTQGVVSVVTDPTGTLTAQTFSTIGTSLDFAAGAEYILGKSSDIGRREYTVSVIVGYGGTTPLQGNTLALAYHAPPFGTVECNELFNTHRTFGAQFKADGIAMGTATNAATPSCLVNLNSVTSVTGATTTTYSPVAILGLSNQDRSSIFGKEIFGFRTIDRFWGAGNTACGTTDDTRHMGPCERGIVDWTFGQDASITGGQMRNFIFKIDGVHPLPVPSVNYIYLFGSVSLRIRKDVNLDPLVLQAADTSALTGTGSSAVPNASTVVLSLVQPNRDFYRFGVGINVSQIFSKLFKAAPPVAAPQVANGQ